MNWLVWMVDEDGCSVSWISRWCVGSLAGLFEFWLVVYLLDWLVDG